MIPLCDAHAHLGDELERSVRLENNIQTMLCATEPVAAQKVQALCAQHSIFDGCYGLHPWYSAAHSVKDMRPYYATGCAVGEIGMDSVWCDVPLETQRSAFLAQLKIAQELMLPVVLHTKGCEEEIARHIRGLKVPVLVHWYSCEEYLDEYLSEDCYFTLGPDLETNPAVRQIAQRAPLNRLLVETDGLSAVRWALDREVPAHRLPGVLTGSLQALAEIKNIAPQEAARQVYTNYQELFYK